MQAKVLLRAELRARRASRSAVDREAAGAGLADHGARLCAGLAVVAAYASLEHEPPTRELLDRLRDAGTRVLLPIVNKEHLDWGDYLGWPALTVGRFGVPAPASAGADLEQAELLLVPALAVDRSGHRLGRGGGYYDRALVSVPPSRLAAVVYADEVLDVVPYEPHDVRVGAALTPDGVVDLGQ